MEGRIAICLLFAFVGSIITAPMKDIPDNSEDSPTDDSSDSDVVYAVIRKINQGYTSPDNVIIQSDIMLPKPGRMATKCTNCLWPISADGTVRVPYVIDDMAYADDELDAISNAMQEYETLTCIRFPPRSKENDYINIINAGGCSSFIGRTGGSQSLQMSSRCVSRGVIQHELNHALGFYHENCRSDRDDYIDVRTEFIDPAYILDFSIANGKTLDLPYDYSSVMHYDKYAFTIDPKEPTIVPIPNPNEPIGQRYGLSVLDIQKINKLYKCNVCSTLLNTPTGTFVSNNFPNGYPNKMNCTWLIRVPRGQVNLTFNVFNIQNTDGCVADYVRIYDGPSRNSPILLDKTCGTFPFSYLLSSADQMLVEFISDESIPSGGFNASYTSVPCGGFLFGTITTFTSPGYSSGSYSDNLNCDYLILAPPGYQITLSGTYELERGRQGNCYFDILTVYPDGYVSSKKSKFCGTWTLPSITSTSNKMLINFVTDSSVVARGFQLTYAFVKADSS